MATGFLGRFQDAPPVAIPQQITDAYFFLEAGFLALDLGAALEAGFFLSAM